MNVVDRRIRTLAVVCVLLGVPALVVAGGRATGGAKPATQRRSTSAREIIPRRSVGPLAGRPAPAFTFRTFDGKRVDSASLRGKIVVLNFFASWCPTCPRELTQLASLSPVIYSYARIVAVAVRDDPAAAKELIARVGGQDVIEAGADTDNTIASAYSILGAPDTVVIGPDGTVASDWRGPVDGPFLYKFLLKTFPETQAGRRSRGG